MSPLPTKRNERRRTAPDSTGEALLDEMFPPSVAEGLRRLGIDAVAIQEIPSIRGLADPDVFVAAQLEGRCLVTENVADFVQVEAAWRSEQESPHQGLVLVAPGAFHDTTGRLSADSSRHSPGRSRPVPQSPVRSCGSSRLRPEPSGLVSAGWAPWTWAYAPPTRWPSSGRF